MITTYPRYLVPLDRVLTARVLGTILVLVLATGDRFVVNHAATVLWDQLALSGTTESDLVTRLVEHFAIDEERARRDVNTFLEMLRTRSLLVESL